MLTHILRVSSRNYSRRLSRALMPAILRWALSPLGMRGWSRKGATRLLQTCRTVLLRALLRACPNWSSNMLTFLVLGKQKLMHLVPSEVGGHFTAEYG